MWFSFGGCVFVVVSLLAVKWKREMAEKTTWGVFKYVNCRKLLNWNVATCHDL